MNTNYHPALFIGAGGTGVRVLRFVQSIAGQGLEPGLEHMLSCHLIRMVGIDTDQEVNAVEESISPNLCRMSCEQRKSSEKVPERLLKLEKVLYCDPRAVTKAVNKMVVGNDDGKEDEAANMSFVKKWFPKAGGGIPPGLATPWAQLRPLGRLALFLQAQYLFEELRKSYQAVRQLAPGSGPVDVHIVCSLGGGTGSGMFWDLAFFIRKIDRDARITGLFVLTEPFEGFNHTGRLYPNVYAALKELHYFKNWIKPLSVEYPIEGNLVFQGKEHDVPAFDRVFLFGGFPAGFEVENRDTATIDVTCFRLAQNLLAYQRMDLRRTISGSHGPDTAAIPGSLERSYCFGASTAVPFYSEPSIDLAGNVFQNLLKTAVEKADRETTTEAPPQDLPPIELDDVLKAFHLETVVGNAPFATPNLKPEPVTSWIGDLEHLEVDLDSEKRKLSVQEMIDHYIPTVFRDMVERYEEGDGVPLDGLQSAYEALIETILKTTDPSSTGSLASLRQENRVLSPEARSALRRIIDDIGHAEERAVPITCPCPQGVEDLFLKPDDVPRRQYYSTLRDRFQFFLQNLKNELRNLPNLQDGVVKPHIYKFWKRIYPESWKALRSLLEEQEQKPTVAAASSAGSLDAPTLQSQAAVIEPPDPESLQSALSLWLPTRRTLDHWLQERAQMLANTFIDAGQRDHRFEVQGLIDQLKPLVLQIQDHLDQGSGKRALPLLRQWLEQLLDPHHLSPAGADRSARTAAWAALSRKVIDQLLGGAHPDNAYGGDLVERLYRARSHVFDDGLVENLINYQALALHPFSSQVSRESSERFSRTLGASGQRVFGRLPQVSFQTTPIPVLFFVDMYRSAEEIYRISDYFAAYERESRDSRALFHIDRQIAEFPEILSLYREATVFCGNPGCSTNLKGLPRSVRFCPGCNQAILNFCGNKDCHAVNVAELIDHERAARRAAGLKDSIPHTCPACSKKLLNYWWQCPHHGEPNPIDKVSCKKCLEEYHQGIRPLKEITSRPDHRYQLCHGCLTLEKDPRFCVQIPPELAPFYRNGVNGHETRVFLGLLQKYNIQRDRLKLASYLCTNAWCEHFLFPTCPIDHNSRQHRHHLYKTSEGRFCCTRHPEIRFHSCYQCGYPVEAEKYEQSCPRCMAELMHCHYCSDIYGRLYPPLGGKKPARCPHCTNLMTMKLDPSLHTVEDGLNQAGFCPNIYGCEAGAHPWDTACEHVDELCAVCPRPGAMRLPREVLEKAVEDCPLCLLTLSPIPAGLRRQPMEPESVLSRFSQRPYDKRGCRICGCKPDLLLDWISRDEKSAEAEDKKTAPSEYQLPSIHFKHALAVLRAFRTVRDPATTYRMVAGHLHEMSHKGSPMTSWESLLSIFPESSKLQQVVHIRIQTLLDEHEKHLTQFRHWHQPGEKRIKTIL
ncbi:MAG: tubulin-like doman-containing protein [Acidobacteriota bacterium]|nr:tubulin-like doman-containing protein [Acidobacteriota bacterium]